MFTPENLFWNCFILFFQIIKPKYPKKRVSNKNFKKSQQKNFEICAKLWSIEPKRFILQNPSWLSRFFLKILLLQNFYFLLLFSPQLSPFIKSLVSNLVKLTNYFLVIMEVPNENDSGIGISYLIEQPLQPKVSYLFYCHIQAPPLRLSKKLLLLHCFNMVVSQLVNFRIFWNTNNISLTASY